MTEASHTIRMTRGMYVVDAVDAERVLKAVEDREPHVLVMADALGDGLFRVPVRLVTAHVMSIAENVDPNQAGEGERADAMGRLRLVHTS